MRPVLLCLFSAAFGAALCFLCVWVFVLLPLQRERVALRSSIEQSREALLNDAREVRLTTRVQSARYPDAPPFLAALCESVALRLEQHAEQLP